MFRQRVSTRGPMFDRRGPATVGRVLSQSERDVANAARDHIRRDLIVVPKHPTGYYRSRITVVKRGAFHQVQDSGVVYGPWLEGVGSRNFPVTRFKGYAFFKRAWQRFRGGAGAIAQRVLSQYMRELR